MDKLQIVLTGDVALSGLFVSEKEFNKERFSDLSGILNESDFSAANLEVMAGSEEFSYKTGERIRLSTKPDVLDEFLDYFRPAVFSLANNHVYDLGLDGYKTTTDLLTGRGVKYTGASFCSDNNKYEIFNVKGRKIVFTAFVHKSCRPDNPEDNFCINYYEDKESPEFISGLRREFADSLIIVSLHWGVDYSYYPEPSQRRIAKDLVSAGCDIIMGHHPHTVQPWERINESLVFYSLGSLCFGDMLYEGRLRALKRKTKRSFMPVIEWSDVLNIEKIISFRELKGNYIKKRAWNYRRFQKIKLFIWNASCRYRLVRFFINVKESFYDRVFEYFFGYYRNPFVQLFKIFNIRKIKYSVRDYRRRKN